MDKLFKIMTFFRIVDVNDQLLSITSISMYISLYRLLTVPNASYTEVGSLLLTLGAHTAKKVINSNKQPSTSKGDNNNA